VIRGSHISCTWTVVLGDFAREAARGNNHLGAATDQALKDLGTDGTGTSASHERVLSLESHSVLGRVLETVQVDASELLAVVPALELVVALEMEERDRLHLGLGDLLPNRARRLAVLLGHHLALAHTDRANEFTVQALDLQLGRLGQLVLLGELVDLLQIVQELGFVAVLGNLAAFRHLLDVVLQFPAARPRNFLELQVSAGIHCRAGTRRNAHILEDGRDFKNILAVLNELLAKLLGELVRLAALSRTVVDVILHEFEESRVGAVHDLDATTDNLSVDDLEPPKDDVEVHVQGVLPGPVPGRIVDTGLERAEDRLDASSVEVTVLDHPEVKLRLKCFLGLLGRDMCLVAGPEIHLEVASEKLELLLEQSSLVLGESIDGGRVHHHAAGRAASRAGG